MKKFGSILLCFVSLSVIGQNKKSGVYLTYQDYLNHKLSYETSNCKEIALHEFLNNSFITVNENGNKIQLKKDSIYGIATCESPLVRFYGNEGYSLVEKGGIWIFSKTIIDHEGKAASTKTVTKYAFSTNGTSKLVDLTLDDVKLAFVNNQKLQNLLAVEFKNDKDLVVFDSIKHEYKIDELIEEAIK